MDNQITEWSWDKPVEAGFYLVCHGDVETPANVEMLHLVVACGKGPKLSNGELYDRDTEQPLADFNGSYKFARLVVGS